MYFVNKNGSESYLQICKNIYEPEHSFPVIKSGHFNDIPYCYLSPCIMVFAGYTVLIIKIHLLWYFLKIWPDISRISCSAGLRTSHKKSSNIYANSKRNAKSP
jgi:hypothetical protein